MDSKAAVAQTLNRHSWLGRPSWGHRAPFWKPAGPTRPPPITNESSKWDPKQLWRRPRTATAGWGGHLGAIGLRFWKPAGPTRPPPNTNESASWDPKQLWRRTRTATAGWGGTEICHVPGRRRNSEEEMPPGSGSGPKNKEFENLGEEPVFLVSATG